MGRLTTHVLDTAHGKPAAGVLIWLYRIETSGARMRLGAFTTNGDGRCDQPLLEGAGFTVGAYELEFHVGDYFARAGVTQAEPKFLDVVTIRFGIAAADQHYHVPLLISPFAYSTYRGS
ncbi:MAG TPA: hydroxyisourate hydrolase [Dongiaceae bacterium]|nr:hydroxyisourate hydrolase [Dongiaceae bacterium]